MHPQSVASFLTLVLAQLLLLASLVAPGAIPPTVTEPIEPLFSPPPPPSVEPEPGSMSGGCALEPDSWIPLLSSDGSVQTAADVAVKGMASISGLAPTDSLSLIDVQSASQQIMGGSYYMLVIDLQITHCNPASGSCVPERAIRCNVTVFVSEPDDPSPNMIVNPPAPVCISIQLSAVVSQAPIAATTATSNYGAVAPGGNGGGLPPVTTTTAATTTTNSGSSANYAGLQCNDAVTPVPPGSWGPVSAGDPDVLAAAQFAVQQIESSDYPTNTLSLVGVLGACVQVVYGWNINFLMDVNECSGASALTGCSVVEAILSCIVTVWVQPTTPETNLIQNFQCSRAAVTASPTQAPPIEALPTTTSVTTVTSTLPPDGCCTPGSPNSPDVQWVAQFAVQKIQSSNYPAQNTGQTTVLNLVSVDQVSFQLVAGFMYILVLEADVSQCVLNQAELVTCETLNRIRCNVNVVFASWMIPPLTIVPTPSCTTITLPSTVAPPPTTAPHTTSILPPGGGNPASPNAANVQWVAQFAVQQIQNSNYPVISGGVGSSNIILNLADVSSASAFFTFGPAYYLTLDISVAQCTFDNLPVPCAVKGTMSCSVTVVDAPNQQPPLSLVGTALCGAVASPTTIGQPLTTEPPTVPSIAPGTTTLSVGGPGVPMPANVSASDVVAAARFAVQQLAYTDEMAATDSLSVGSILQATTQTLDYGKLYTPYIAVDVTHCDGVPQPHSDVTPTCFTRLAMLCTVTVLLMYDSNTLSLSNPQPACQTVW